MLSNPLFWAACVALLGLALTVKQLFARKAVRQHRRPDKLDEWKNETRIQSDYWEGPLASPDDRRQRSRRQAAPKEIHFRISEGAIAKPGFVIDRSSGGLRLALEQALPVDSHVFLKADQAPSGTPWAEAVVCWCKPMDDRFDLGCQFVGNVPWNVLLLFG